MVSELGFLKHFGKSWIYCGMYIPLSDDKQ